MGDTMRFLYGGAFNPPTIAHYNIVKYLYNNYRDAKIIILPTNTYYKSNTQSFNDRKNMLTLMLKEFRDRIEISDFEEKQKSFTGTYLTLKAFNHPCFVMGADQIFKLDTWINFQALVEENKFLVFPRANINVLDYLNNHEILQKYINKFIIIKDFKELVISSSLYRSELDSSLLTNEVSDYIKQNNLYQNRKE